MPEVSKKDWAALAQLVAKYTRAVIAQTLIDMDTDVIARRHGPKKGKRKCDPDTESAAAGYVKALRVQMSVADAKERIFGEVAAAENALATFCEALRLVQAEERRADGLVDDVNTFLDMERAGAAESERKAAEVVGTNTARIKHRRVRGALSPEDLEAARRSLKEPKK